MALHRLMPIVAVVSFINLFVSPSLPQQDASSHSAVPMRYKLIDLGMGSFFDNIGPKVINKTGVFAGEQSTSTPDPYAPDCFADCQIDLAFQWAEGKRRTLPTLPGGVSTFAYWINDGGVIAGIAQNGKIDPATGWPEQDAVLWLGDQVYDLGTLGGAGSAANAVNNRGQVVGCALNEIGDPFANVPLAGGGSFSFAFTYLFAPSTTQVHAFLWQQRTMRDLGTLGGTDSCAGFVNNDGQVAGSSFTSNLGSNGVPEIHSFFWQDGNMVDLGTLGGTNAFPFALNDRGEVIGYSDLAGDATVHPFLWSEGKLIDLGTLGGQNGVAFSINDHGEIAGESNLLDGTFHAFIWKSGLMIDLGTLHGDPCSQAFSINSKGQTVGITGPCIPSGAHGFLSHDGGPMVDLQSLVLPGADVRVIGAEFIGENGEIAGFGADAGGHEHGILLIPCDENHQDIEGCDNVSRY